MTQAQAYYQSHSKLKFFGLDGQTSLSGAKVLMIGAGGLGCPCLVSLTGCGIGTIGIADFDHISVSNLHRQFLYGFDEIGKPKVVVAGARLKQHNPYIHIVEHQLLVDESNILDLIRAYDVVIDGTDNFTARYLINDACVYLDKPLVYGAIYQTEGHVTVFNYQQSATLRCLFSEPDAETYVPSCAEVGAYNVVTAVVGNIMASETVKVILQSREILANKLVTYDALNVEMRTIGYKAAQQSRVISLNRFSRPETDMHITPEDFLKLESGSYYLIDVREDWEREERDFGGKHIPLNTLNRYDFSIFAKKDLLICYCEQGKRSETAAKFLHKLGYLNAVSLQCGIAGLDFDLHK